jgi:site-specific DNA-adenine methylase
MIATGSWRRTVDGVPRVAAREILFRARQSISPTECSARWTGTTLVYLDPPYNEQGRELYYAYYQPKDHAKLAHFIRTNTKSVKG